MAIVEEQAGTGNGPAVDDDDDGGEVEHHRVAIIGTGFGGMGAAIALKQAGHHDIVLLERASTLGGTWRDNHYPGCQCDVPSHLYSFSFALKPDWSRSFAEAGEIQEYLQETADRFDIRRHMRFDSEVLSCTWLAEQQRWHVVTASGELTAQFVIGAWGPLSEPAFPDLPGLDTFEGPAMHSAQWDHDVDLAGKSVAVIGTGASAIQIVPSIQPTVGHLDLYQRTAPWVVPRPDRPIKPWLKKAYARVPGLQRLARAAIYWNRELLIFGFAKHPVLMHLPRRLARAHLRHQVPDAALRATLTPTFDIGCKRILLSNDYYPALTQPNTAVVTAGIAEVRPRSIITTDGVEHPTDVIVYGTGFHVTDHPMADRIVGADGHSVAVAWSKGMEAYRGTTVAGFPNLFALVGPNTGLGHTSIVFMIEAQLQYVLDALRQLDARGIATFDVRPEVQGAFNDDLAQQLEGTVWNSGCASWYLDERGRNTTLWPTFTFRYRQLMARFDAESYHLEATRVPTSRT